MSLPYEDGGAIPETERLHTHAQASDHRCAWAERRAPEHDALSPISTVARSALPQPSLPPRHNSAVDAANPLAWQAVESIETNSRCSRSQPRIIRASSGGDGNAAQCGRATPPFRVYIPLTETEAHMHEISIDSTRFAAVIVCTCGWRDIARTRATAWGIAALHLKICHGDLIGARRALQAARDASYRNQVQGKRKCKSAPSARPPRRDDRTTHPPKP